MSEKVRLPKSLCDALDLMTEFYKYPESKAEDENKNAETETLHTVLKHMVDLHKKRAASERGLHPEYHFAIVDVVDIIVNQITAINGTTETPE